MNIKTMYRDEWTRILEKKVIIKEFSYGGQKGKISLLKILKVTDDAGNNIACTHHAQFLSSPVSSAIIEYQYLPKEAVLEGEICYAEKDVTPNVLTYGVLAEYQITQGSFDEAVMWHKRYAGGIETICFPQNVKSKSRRWV